jgi:hypothetical protein
MQAGGRMDGYIRRIWRLFYLFCHAPKYREDWVAWQGVAFVYFEKTVKCCGKQTGDINTWIKPNFPLFLAWPFRKLKFLSSTVISHVTPLFETFIFWHIILQLFFIWRKKMILLTTERNPTRLLEEYNLVLHMADPKSTDVIDAWNIVQRSR